MSGDRVDEYFQAWSVAGFIGKVVAAGKKEYALPMYVNAACAIRCPTPWLILTKAVAHG